MEPSLAELDHINRLSGSATSLAIPLARRLDFLIVWIAICLVSFALLAFLGLRKSEGKATSTHKADTVINIPGDAKIEVTFVAKNEPQTAATPVDEPDDAQSDQMQFHKILYFKLQNLEQYPEILPQARDLLVTLLSEVLDDACKEPLSGILSVKDYTRNGLVRFLQEQDEETMAEWELIW